MAKKRLGGKVAQSRGETSVNGIDLTDNPLTYHGDDKGFSGPARTLFEAQEKKRKKNKIEFLIMADENGNQFGKEHRGGSGSVRTPMYDNMRAHSKTHNHPRSEAGRLGGTFSDSDLRNFSRFPNQKVLRASAAEGIYHIRKLDGFERAGFDRMVSTTHTKLRNELNGVVKDLNKQIRAKTITYDDARAASDKAFNKFLVNMHNELSRNAKDYNYDYRLERWK